MVLLAPTDLAASVAAKLVLNALSQPVEQVLTHYHYFTLAMLSEAPERTLRLTALAARTNATLPRLSRVVSRLEQIGFVERKPCPEDRRATNARLTPAGWDKVVQAAPGHVATVREYVVDALTPTQLRQLGGIAGRLLERLDPDGRTSRVLRAIRPSRTSGDQTRFSRADLNRAGRSRS